MTDSKLQLKKCETDILREIHCVCERENITYYLIAGTLLGAVRHKGFIPWDDDIDIGMPRDDYNKFIKIFNEKTLNPDLSVHTYLNDKSHWLPFAKVRNDKTVMKETFQSNFDGSCGVWVDIFPLDNAKRQKSFMQKLQADIAKTLYSMVFAKIGTYNIKQRSFVTRFAYFFVKRLNVKNILRIVTKVMTANKNNSSKYFVNLSSQYNSVKQTMPKSVYNPRKLYEFEGEMFYSVCDADYYLTRLYGDYMTPPRKSEQRGHEISELDLQGNKNV